MKSLSAKYWGRTSWYSWWQTRRRLWGKVGAGHGTGKEGVEEEGEREMEEEAWMRWVYIFERISVGRRRSMVDLFHGLWGVICA